ncbi:iron complex transport system substrate-binding protein [Saccharopolyspora lacisalsi]|uniref:Iron complex transport system substrate-binding protein n=1 Tax=Halosaccharopolyspora lacisalsi TaxID=1000566 RepID=A0A839DWM2_9PSEU|nr:iron-siderophore ABC transporter substrate-binding protein [Halosaccharopolyspora lacisalsi]MBA8823735.1 iron complex transport system substrate-binding protein [Halosaccharopolyspora lacisalsi]
MGVRRRSGMVLGALISTVMVLAGCSSPASQERSGDPGSGSWDPVTVSTAFGDVTIPEKPQRVVALGWGDAEVALALGVRPVGAADWLGVGGDGLGPWVERRYAGEPPPMLGTMRVDMERLAALKPDLILDTRASGDPARYERLTALGVPVVSIPKGAESYATSWKDQLALIGTALGEKAEARRLRTELETKLRQAARANPQFAGATTVVGARTANSYSAYVEGTSRVNFMRALGFRNSPAVQRLSTGKFSVPISRERLDLLDADLTVMTTIGVGTEVLRDDPLYRAVPSVAAGHSVVLEEPAVKQAFASGSVVGLSWVVDRVVPMFAAAMNR